VEVLDGKVAVVTGAASGIGLAIAEAFVAEGVKVAIADLNLAAATAEAKRLRDAGGDVRAFGVDVSSAAAVEELAGSIVRTFDGIHIAVNNAGVVDTGLSWELSVEQWRRVIDIDLWGVIHGIRSFVPRILATGEAGHVVNTASLAAVTAIPRLGPYTVAKHGVLGASDVLRAELASVGAPIGVSVVMPGMIKTGMVPIGKIPPSQVALNVVDAIRRNRPYVYTDNESATQVSERLRAIVDARAEVRTE
jgi:NAD(P)-dependent dehydrogenase (short-subunit alcohol dehydrogenase family)